MVRLRTLWRVGAPSFALLPAGGQAEQTPLKDAPGGNPLTREFGDFVRQKLDRWKVPGMSLAVVDGHDVNAQVRAAGAARKALAERGALMSSLS